MNTERLLAQKIGDILVSLYGVADEVQLQPTRRDFEGHYTFVVFPLVKALKKAPPVLGAEIGEALLKASSMVASYNVVQGFLNIVLHDAVWIGLLNEILADSNFGVLQPKAKGVLVEYSSPNTNKPLHLGHLRNNFLGYAIANILAANGWEVTKACLVNDRGIHICKSMIAYERFGNNETPQSAGIKGDHLVGKYYVAFDKAYKREIEQLVQDGQTEEEAKKNAPLLKAAQQMLLKWEQNDAAVVDLWKKMNGWVYEGFNATYKQIGVNFDKTYYESATYLLGKDLVDEGLANGVFYKKSDGSVWIDLTEEGLDEKLVLRADGTSVYITQDIGTTDLKFRDFTTEKSIWVVGNEQDYHFQVLFAILKKLGKPYAEGCYHMSYGMVDLPSGKMKSREGTVVDADELVADMIAAAETTTRERGKIDDFGSEEARALFEMLALGALKYFLLKVEPKKRMLFNPEESIDFQGNTGPFIQYTHARIKSILRKAVQENISIPASLVEMNLEKAESELIFLIAAYPAAVAKAGEEYAPSIIANYTYELAKSFSSFYNEYSVMNEPNEQKRGFRLALIKQIADTLKKAMGLLGIEVPEQM